MTNIIIFCESRFYRFYESESESEFESGSESESRFNSMPLKTAQTQIIKY